MTGPAGSTNPSEDDGAVTNPERQPIEQWCRSGGADSAAGPAPRADAATPAVQLLAARDVPLGGPRAMTVRRTLPQRGRSLIGAWCFADHYGPDDVSGTGGMDVAPHPHTGLQTVSWLFAGTIEHRDSLGVHALVRPGEVNLMTAGHGIAHSEVSVPGTDVLHGVQLWVALPDYARDFPRDFEHHAPEPIDVGGAVVRVFVGSLFGQASPVRTYTPLVGAEILLAAGQRLDIPVDPGHEHGVLLDSGTFRVGDVPVAPAQLAYVSRGTGRITIDNPGVAPARLLLLGGEPFGEELVMWWNFVGRSHDEIVAFRQAWEERSERFGAVSGYTGEVLRLPAPVLPNVRIKPRRNA